MADNSKIEWTDASWNPVRAVVTAPGGKRLKWGYHCEHVTEACTNCYAEAMNRRNLPGWGTGLDYKPGYLRQIPDALCDKLGYPRGSRVMIEVNEDKLTGPLRWKKPRRIFTCSTTDLFAGFVSDAMRDRIFAVMALCPQHTFQLLTKRPENAKAYLANQRATYQLARKVIDMTIADKWLINRMINEIHDQWPVISEGDPEWPDDIKLRAWPLPNVWLGVSVEDVKAKSRIDALRQLPATTRFLSLEPLLEDLGEVDLSGIDLAIMGGESGAGARPCYADWLRSIVAQCRAQGVRPFVKQLGSAPFECSLGIPFRRELKSNKGGDMSEWPDDLRVREMPGD